jgi:hypothetical protein
MPRYYENPANVGGGSTTQDHDGGFESFAHAVSTVNHLLESGGKGTTSNTSSLKYLKPLDGETTPNKIELLRRCRLLLGNHPNGEAHGRTGDIRVFWVRRLMAELTSETADHVTREIDRAVG